MGLLSHSVVAACAALLAVTFTSPPPGLQPVVAQLKRHAYDTFAPPVGHRWNAHKVSLSQYNNKWDGSVPSVLTISSGECVEIHSVRAGVHTSCSRSCELLRPPALLKEPNATRHDAYGGRVTRESTVEIIKNIPSGSVNPVHGPVAVAGAEPGDVLKVDILRIDLDSFGWVAVIPGFGLLADAEPPLAAVNGPAFHIVEIPPWYSRWINIFGVRVPFSPHIGSMGVAPPVDRGALSCLPPDVHGGNLDTRHLTKGSTALFPIHVAGARFSLGDVHAAQGDGEVCGTGIEVGARVTVRLTLLKAGASPDARGVKEWQLRIPGGPFFPRFGNVIQAPRDGARIVTTGFAPDLLTASRKAVLHMIEVIKQHKPELTTEQAYMLVSLAGDLRISQIVDMPHFSVAVHLPAAVLQ